MRQSLARANFRCAGAGTTRGSAPLSQDAASGQGEVADHIPDPVLAGEGNLRDLTSGTCQIGVRLARGALRRPLRMRLNIDHWSATSTALTLIPCQPVRPGTAYFHAGRRLLDSLTCAAGAPASAAALQQRQHTPVTRLSGHPPAGREPEIPGVRQPVPALARRHTS